MSKKDLPYYRTGIGAGAAAAAAATAALDAIGQVSRAVAVFGQATRTMPFHLGSWDGCMH